MCSNKKQVLVKKEQIYATPQEKTAATIVNQANKVTKIVYEFRNKETYVLEGSQT